MTRESDLAAEHHRSHRSGWLRAAVLGANDGIVSMASLVIGVAAAGGSRSAVLTAGVAGSVAGAMSMAAGEYISVSSQRDVELADLRIEAAALAEHPDDELEELAEIYVRRGLDEELALTVAGRLMAHDMLAAHARDELGITEIASARPLQAAWASATAFAVGALVPVVSVVLSPISFRVPITVVAALCALVALGALGAFAGGAPWKRAALRVVTWSSLAMALTYGIGALVGTQVD